MARSGAVLAGLRASQAAAQSSAGKPHPSYVSPLLGQYAQWTMGRTGQMNSLPRDPLTFLTGAFGPLAPIKPIGIDEPQGDASRPDPRRWQYPVAWNMPVGAPGSEGLKLADFQTLRLYSEIYSIARACIQLRKDEILGVGWDIGPTHDASKAMRGDRVARRDFGERRAQMLRFFRRPDPEYNDFTTWLEAVLEEIFVIDALSIYLHPSRIPGKGLLGTDLAALDLIAGDTIRPLIDLRGGTPAPPNPAYQQYMYGVPRVDLMSVMTADDAKDLGVPVREYRGDQFLYLPRNPRSWTPYGQAPIERCIVPVITGLRKQQYAMDFFLEGSIPGMFVTLGDPELTPNQIREWQDTLNALAGDQAWKHKMIGLPAGSAVHPQKPPELADQSDEVIMNQVCMAFSVMPMELGIYPKVARNATASVYSGEQMARASMDLQERKSLKPDLLWLKNALFDRVIQGICGQHDMEWRWDGLQEDRDELTMTQLLTQQISFGLTSIDEARIEIGRDPWGMEITSDPGWATAAGFLPLGAVNPDTGMPYANEGLQPNGVAAIPGSEPGSSRSGRAPVGGKLPETGPRRPSSAGPQGPDPVPGTRRQSPGHDAAAASEIGRGRVRKPVPKAMMSELDALRRHLLKGRDAETWEARNVPPEVMELLCGELLAGTAIEEAVETATGLAEKLISGDGLIIEKREIDDKARAVARQLGEDYPEDSLGWVLDDAVWSGPAEVPLDKIDFSHRRTWNAWHERDRVAGFMRKIRRKAKTGEHIKPVVLVDRPDTERGTHLIVIDGHHRSLAALKAGVPVWAYTGKVDRVEGPWLEFHNRQRREGAGTSEYAAKAA